MHCARNAISDFVPMLRVGLHDPPPRSASSHSCSRSVGTRSLPPSFNPVLVQLSFNGAGVLVRAWLCNLAQGENPA